MNTYKPKTREFVDAMKAHGYDEEWLAKMTASRGSPEHMKAFARILNADTALRTLFREAVAEMQETSEETSEENNIAAGLADLFQ